MLIMTHETVWSYETKVVNGSPVKASTHKDETFCLTPSFKTPINFHISFPLNVFKPKLSLFVLICVVLLAL